MTDDTSWINGVVALQDAGRKVTCCTGPAESSRETAAKGWLAEYNHQWVEPGSIAGPKSN